MTTEKIVFTLFAKDRPGILSDLSSVVLAHQANWLHSSASRLCGQFSGIAQIEVDRQHKDSLLNALGELTERGVYITVQQTDGFVPDTDEVEGVQLLIETGDRAGVIEEITGALDDASISIDQIDTEVDTENGQVMFRAHLFVVLPDDVSEQDLNALFAELADDLTISILDE